MPSTYTTNLGIELPADGELDGVWGDVVNENMDILDRAINGSVALTLSGTTSTLTTSDGALSDGQYKLLVLGGTPSGTHTITIAPSDAQKIYFVRNTTAQSVVFTQGSGGNVTIATGDSAIIYSDGAGAGAAVVNITNDFAMSSVKITGGTIDGTVIGGTSAAAGTFTTVTGTSFVSSGDMTFGDNDKAIFGAGSDLQIYHDGTNSYIDDQGSGRIIIKGNDDVRIRSGADEEMIVASSNGAVTLYHDSFPKFTTNATGVGVTGNATFADNGKAIFGAGSDFQIYHDGVNNWVDAVSGVLLVRGSRVDLRGANDELLLVGNQNGAVTLYYDNAAKLATTATGVTVTGDVGATTGTFSGDVTIADKIVHSGDTNTAIRFPAADTVTVETAGTERLRITDIGRVGLGVTNPAARLQVAALSSSSATVIAATEVDYTANFRSSQLIYNPVDTTGTLYGFSNSNLGALSFLNTTNAVIGTNGATPLAFATNSVERMRITSAGNVGIGTTAPAAKLEVALGANGEYMRVGGDDATNNRALRFTSSTTGGSVGALHTINASSSSGVIALATNSTERLRITSAGNLLLGTTTDFTSTTTAGGMALTGYGVYPYTTQTGATNSSSLSSLTALPAVAATGSAGITLAGGQFSPAMSNDGTGGSSAATLVGVNSIPVITSSGSTALVSLTAVQGTANRGNASDTSANASNSITAGSFIATHGVSLPTTAVSGTVYGLSGAIINASGTMTAASAVRAGIFLGSTSTFNTNSTPTAVGFELSSFNVGAATAVGNATVTNGYGVKLVGPTVLATGTMTNYYAFRADSPTVTGGTLTNRYGIWINDPLSTNYFAGNVGIGTSSPAAGSKLSVYSAASTDDDDLIALGFGGFTPHASIGTHNQDANNGGIKFSTKGASTLAERMRIDSAGNVGIGTASPATLLSLQAATPTLTSVSTTTTGTTLGNKGNRVLLQSNSSTAGNGGELVWAAADTNTGRWAAISGHIVGNASGSAFGDVVFATKTAGADTALSERLRLTAAGALVIGNGDTAASPAAGFLRATGGSGTDITGAALNIQGGRGTGTGAGGIISFSTAAAGTTGTTLNAATERMRIDSIGRVGIGTTGMSYTLDVRDGTGAGINVQTTSGNAQVRINSVASGSARLDLVSSPGTQSIYGGVGSVNNMVFYVNATETMRLDVLGNLGLGTSTPNTRLTISSSGANGLNLAADQGNSLLSSRLMLSNGTAGQSVVLTNNSGGLSFGMGGTPNVGSGTEVMRITSAGNVGIGTTSPTNPLDVNADSIRVRTAQTPATAGAAGNQGEIAWDADYIYVCTATNTWKRVAIATW